MSWRVLSFGVLGSWLSVIGLQARRIAAIRGPLLSFRRKCTLPSHVAPEEHDPLLGVRQQLNDSLDVGQVVRIARRRANLREERPELGEERDMLRVRLVE